MNSSENASALCDDATSGLSIVHYVNIGLMLVLMVLVCGGNGMILIAFIRSSHLKTMTNFYIVQLAIADFGVGCTMPFHVVIFFQEWVVLEYVQVCLLRYTSLMFFGAASICGLAALTHDRYSAVTRPLRYQETSTWHTYTRSALLIWLIPLVGNVLVPVWWNNGQDSQCPTCDFGTILPRDYFRVVVVPSFVVLCAVISAMYARILCIARQQARKIEDIIPGQQRDKSRKNSRHQMKLVKAGLIIFVTFYACWCPFFATVAAQAYTGNYRSRLLLDVRLFATFISVANSAVNPIIYAFRLPAFRHELRRMFCGQEERKRAWEHSSGSASGT